MGVVYLARQHHIGRLVALKLLHPEREHDETTAEQFLVEANVISRLKSPYTVTLYDVGPLQEGGYFFAMEYLEGVTLRERLSRGLLPVMDAIEIVDAIALSLSEAHQQRIVHRDLKPLNVFLVRTPGHADQVRVLDFGLAQLHDAPHRIGGTPRYMAPESFHGGAVDPRVDVYAMGLLLYETLTGRHPFGAVSGDALLTAQCSQEPPPLSRPDEAPIPEALGALVHRSLAKAARLRPRDAQAFRLEMRAAMGLRVDRTEEGSGSDHTAASGPQAATETATGVKGSVDEQSTDSRTVMPSIVSRASVSSAKRIGWAQAASFCVGLLGVWGAWQFLRQEELPALHTPSLARVSAPAELTSSTSATPAVESVASTAPVEHVTILVHSVPDNAVIEIDGKPHGKTPAAMTFKRGVETRLTLHLPGYQPSTLKFTPSADQLIRRVLVSQHRPRPATAVTTSPRGVHDRVNGYFD